jgi:hypothetical protein
VVEVRLHSLMLVVKAILGFMIATPVLTRHSNGGR